MKKLFRDDVLKIEHPVPEKPVELLRLELGIDEETFKLDSNENLLGVSPLALDAVNLALAEGNIYPDNSCYELREKLGKILGFPMSNIRVGNGSSELIYLAGVALLERDDNMIISQYSFIVPKLITQIIGCTVKEVPLEGYHHDLDGILAAIDEHTKIIYLDMPMNPIGTSLTRAKFERFMDDLPDDVLLICDEAYHEYAEGENFPNTLPFVKDGRDIIVLRTFSKLHGLAGFRVGYCVAREEIIEALRRVSLPFSVNSFAQIAAIAALDDRTHMEKTLEITAAGKRYLYEQFDEMSIFHIPSETNFVTIDVNRDSREICAGLLKRGVKVRPLTGYGKPTFLRVTIGTMDQNIKFAEALKEIYPVGRKNNGNTKY